MGRMAIELFNVAMPGGVAMDASVPSGLKLKFKNVTPEDLRLNKSKFMFSIDSRNRYRLHSGKHDYEKMLFMLGARATDYLKLRLPRRLVGWKT